MPPRELKKLNKISTKITTSHQQNRFLPRLILTWLMSHKDRNNNLWYGFLSSLAWSLQAEFFINLKWENLWQSWKKCKHTMTNDSNKFKRDLANFKRCKKCTKFTGTNFFTENQGESQVTSLKLKSNLNKCLDKRPLNQTKLKFTNT